MTRQLVTLVILIGLLAVFVLGTETAEIRLLDRIATHLCINLVLVLGLQVFMGNSGILSFAHIGFMGVGAYTSAVLTIPVQMKGMALPELYPLVAGVQLSPYLGIIIGGFTAAAVVAAFAVVLALAFKESRTGLLLRATRDDETAAGALGAHIPRLRWRAFILSAFLAGIGGSLWGHFITSFSPKAFYLKETFVILGMLVIGGPNTVSGAVFGVFIITGAFEGLRAVEAGLNRAQIFSEQVVGLTEIVLALAMIAVLVLRPSGLFATREVGTLLTRSTFIREKTRA